MKNINNVAYILFVFCVHDLKLVKSTSQNESSLEEKDPIYPAVNQCFLINNQPFKLVWSDEFVNENDLAKNWIVEHEEGYCTGNGNGQEASCNVEQNVNISNGFMVLAARYEKYFDRNFTAAKVTSKRFFSKGRYEIRASQPVGKQLRTCMFTVNSNDLYWHQSGQIDLMCVLKSTDTYRGMYFANSSDENNVVVKGQIYKSLHQFHLYGVEWDDTSLRFFFDDLYSQPVMFSEGKGLNRWHQIRMQFGVGGRYYEPMPADFNQLYWRCPAFVFDYIRIFEKVESPQNSTNKSCVDYAEVVEQSRDKDEMTKLHGVCTSIMDSIKYEPMQVQELRTNLMPILIIILILIFLATIIYLMIRIAKLKTKIRMGQTRLQDYENFYYDTPQYETDIPKTNSYLQLQDAIMNEYMSIKKIYQDKSSKAEGFDTESQMSSDSDWIEHKYLSIKKKLSLKSFPEKRNEEEGASGDAKNKRDTANLETIEENAESALEEDVTKTSYSNLDCI